MHQQCISHNYYFIADATLTQSKLIAVLKNVVSISKLKGCLNIPHSVWRTIRKNCESEELQRDECIYYWRNVLPFSMFGWSFLGGKLHYLGEESALKTTKEYIQTAPGTYEYNIP